MKGNRELDDLLLSYILKELNAEEETFVQEYIRSGESNRRHYEEIRDTWKAIMIKKGLERVDINEEWEHFEQLRQREKQQLVADRAERKMEEELAEPAVEGYDRQRRRRVVVSVAIAAALSALIVSGWLLLPPKRPTAAGPGEVAAQTPKPLSPMKNVVNSTGQPEKLLLPDGSEVVLEAKSEIRYAEAFAEDKRDITLLGKADFKVSQDKSRPFTVYSMGLATTALGTAFTVSAFEEDENVVIRLHEGKIVIKKADAGKAGLKEDYYLLPGQSFIYNNRNYTAKLLETGKKKNRQAAGTGNEEAYTDLPDLPENNKGSWYMFNNASLASVFDQLALFYNTGITYEKKDISNLYFAGKFDKSDSLSTILRQIAAVNNLKVIKKGNKYIITR